MAAREIKSEITGSLWKIVKRIGDRVEEEDTIMILESMKMEIPVLAECSGTIKAIPVSENDPISEGQVVAVIDEDASG